MDDGSDGHMRNNHLNNDGSRHDAGSRRSGRGRHAAASSPSVRRKRAACAGLILIALAFAASCFLWKASPFHSPEESVAPAPEMAPAALKAGSGQLAEKISVAASAVTLPERPDPEKMRAELGIIEDYRPEFNHGEKTAEHQRYIVLHDTEGEGDPQSVVDFWAGNGNLVAAHFIVGKDGTIVQCVPLDAIAHHVGFGDAGHNASFGVEDESRDDKLGTVPIGSWAPDYGMNSYSIGIEMVHVGGSGDYPQEQLEAVDALIAYIDAYYGFESEIIDHKAWRSGNSDTSPEFAPYFENYKDHRTHAPAA